VVLGEINWRSVYAVRPQPSGVAGEIKWLKAAKLQPNHVANLLPFLFLRITHCVSIAYDENVCNRMILNNRVGGGVGV